MAGKKKAAAPMNEKIAERNAELRRRSLAQIYNSEEKVAVSIPPLYKPYFGESMSVSVNGFLVVIPCDGRPHEIPKTHADEALARIRKTDNILMKKDAMRDISSNFETSPGAIQFF